MGALFLNVRQLWQFDQVELAIGVEAEIQAFGTWLRGRIESVDGLYCLVDPHTGSILCLREGLIARVGPHRESQESRDRLEREYKRKYGAI